MWIISRCVLWVDGLLLLLLAHTTVCLIVGLLQRRGGRRSRARIQARVHVVHGIGGHSSSSSHPVGRRRHHATARHHHHAASRRHVPGGRAHVGHTAGSGSRWRIASHGRRWRHVGGVGRWRYLPHEGVVEGEGVHQLVAARQTTIKNKKLLIDTG